MAGEDLAWHPETPLNPEVYAKGTKQRQLTQKLHDLFFAEQHNLDGDYVATVPAGKTRFGIKMGDEVREVLADLPEGLDQEDVRQQAFRSANREAARVRRQVLDNWNAMTKKERRLVGGDRDAYLEAYAPKVVALDGKNVVELQSSPNLVKQRAPLLPQGSILKALDQFGPEYQEWSGAVKKEWKRSFVNYVGDSDHFEKTGGLQFDDRKLDRLVSSLQSSWASQGSMGAVDAGAASVQGKELLLSLIDEFEFNKAAGMSFDDAKKHLMGKFKEAVNVRQWDEERWAPLNSFVKGKLSTGKVPPERLEMDTQKIMETAPWSASKAYVDKIAPLTQKETMFDPEYLERIAEDLGGLTDEGQDIVSFCVNGAILSTYALLALHGAVSMIFCVSISSRSGGTFPVDSFPFTNELRGAHRSSSHCLTLTASLNLPIRCFFASSKDIPAALLNSNSSIRLSNNSFPCTLAAPASTAPIEPCEAQLLWRELTSRSNFRSSNWSPPVFSK
jgi:hypothetical protein